MDTKNFKPSPAMLMGIRGLRPAAPWSLALDLASALESSGFPPAIENAYSSTEFTQTNADQTASLYYGKAPGETIGQACLSWEAGRGLESAQAIGEAVAKMLKGCVYALGPAISMEQIAAWDDAGKPDQACVCAAFWPVGEAPVAARHFSEPDDYFAEMAKYPQRLTLATQMYADQGEGPQRWTVAAVITI